ncbi:MAG: hypothetical protein ABSD28_01880 [Tepidisphaeraceae bacterium]|jgi:hypothetical protein
MRYTLRKIPRDVDAALRQRARQEGKSLNQVALEALSRGLGIAQAPTKFHDLDFVIGTWVEDPEFDKAIEAQRQIDPEMWK